MIECADNETWKPVLGAEGFYSVSNLGRVRSEPLPHATIGRQRGRILKPCLDTKGYPIVGLCLPGQRRRTMKVHRVVAITFIRPPTPGEQVNHKNGVKTDNRTGNLEYVSCLENIHHCWRTGLHGTEHCRGSRNPQAKLTDDAVRTIRGAYPNRSLTDLAKQFGVTPQAIAHVVKGETWADVKVLT